MAGLKDKLLLNEGGIVAGGCAVSGNQDAVEEQFKTASMVAAEIEKHGLLWHPDVVAFKSNVESVCVALDDAQDAYLKAMHEGRLQLRALTDKMRTWLDRQIQSAPPAP
jgi:hypothetical protein